MFKKQDQRGFTIIEVLIVLAIAGLILLIVFLAVPALQRNSRNTQIRNDVASVFGMVSEFSSNNQGRLPVDIASNANGDVGMVLTGTANPVTNKVGQVRAGTVVEDNTTPPTATQTGRVHVALNYGCNGNVLGSAKPRSIAALFNVEGAGGNIAQCQES